MEDLDPPREVPGAGQAILDCLGKHGLEWDGPVVYQSQRRSLYDEALAQLRSQGLLFPCTCSRTKLGGHSIYPGYCRDQVFPQPEEHAVRIRNTKPQLEFTDIFQGKVRVSCGDFVVLRKDNWIAYQLAVVVDDHLQGITEVVRGLDLLESTPRQLYLFMCLNWKAPGYAHHPLAVDSRGQKLGKRNHAPAMNPEHASENLSAALNSLGQQAPPETLSVSQTLDWAIEHWDPSPLIKLKALRN